MVRWLVLFGVLLVGCAGAAAESGTVLAHPGIEGDYSLIYTIEAGDGGAEVQRTTNWPSDPVNNVPVVWDTERWDTGDFWSPDEPTLFRIPPELDGKRVRLHAAGIWASGPAYKEIKIIRNRDVHDPVAVVQTPGALTGNTGLELESRPILVRAGDVFEVAYKSGR